MSKDLRRLGRFLKKYLFFLSCIDLRCKKVEKNKLYKVESLVYNVESIGEARGGFMKTEGLHVKERHDIILNLVLDKGYPSREVGQVLAHAEDFLLYGETGTLEKYYAGDIDSPFSESSMGETGLRALEECDRQKISMVFLGDPDYPPMLKEIQDPPAILFFKGKREALSRETISVVGARRATPYGRQAAYEIAKAAARRGIAVVSGLAVGIDGEAHKGALDAEGCTMAVMAGSLEDCYPKSHRWLFDKMQERGAVISEYPPGTSPQRWHFVARNRIVSGMSRIVVVAQAGIRSGSLITAMNAAEQARDVYCVPGSVYDPEYLGSHRLIQDGANILCSIRDLFTEDGTFDQCALAMPEVKKSSFLPRRDGIPEAEAWNKTKQLRKKTKSLSQAAGEWRWLYEAIDDFGTGAEELHQRTGRDPALVQMGLSELEIAGLIEHNGGLVVRKQS